MQKRLFKGVLQRFGKSGFARAGWAVHINDFRLICSVHVFLRKVFDNIQQNTYYFALLKYGEVILAIFQSIICLIACHGGAANHFAVFAKALEEQGHTVEIYATGPAIKKFQQHHITNIHMFSLEEGDTNEEVAARIAAKCAKAAIVITDVGHAFAICLQDALLKNAPKSLKIAYYDNPESYVPGGYSAIASKVMQKAQKSLFANANLAKLPIYETPSKQVPLQDADKIGLGYYPASQGEKIAEKRDTTYSAMRRRFFMDTKLQDTGQKILVYTGGNNTEYFEKAFPAFLQYIADLPNKQDMKNILIVLQQHPGAKAKNIDRKLLEDWMQQNGSIPQFCISSMSTDDALVIADAALYYQTSMAPQFVIAGIPTVQVGHEIYQDVLVKNQLCVCVNSGKDFAGALESLQKKPVAGSLFAVKQGLGMRDDWAEVLKNLAK